jgi:hypothetical protein
MTVRCAGNCVGAIFLFDAAQGVGCRIGSTKNDRRISEVAEFYPIVSSAPREPDRRPRPIPPKIKAVVHNLIWGRDDDPGGMPMDLIAACAAAGVKPFVARRFLDRPQVIAHLRAELRKRREVDRCGNSAALRRVRDSSDNSMAVVNAARALDGMGADDPWRADAGVSPGVTLRIVHIEQPIDVTPRRIIDAE